MGTASSKISDTGDVKVDIPVNYQAFTFKLTKDHVTNPAFIPMMTKEHVEHSAFIPTPTKERVENPAFIPTPSEKQDAYKDVIVSPNHGPRCRFRKWLTFDVGIASTGPPHHP